MANEEFVVRSPEGIAHEKRLRQLKADLARPTPELRVELDAMNAELRQRALTPGAVTTTPVLQNLAIGYRNDELIGTRLMPVVSTSSLGMDDGDLSCEYWVKNKNTVFEIGEDDAIGTRGTVNEVEAGASMTSTTLQRRAKKRFVDAWTQAAMDNIVQRMLNPTILVSDQLALRQEQRIATILCTSGNYGSNTTALSGTDVWTAAGQGDPLACVENAKANLWSGAPGMTVGFTSYAVASILRQHPDIVDTFKYTNGGRVSMQQLADFFELDMLLVGKARYNSAKEGETAVYSRLWTNVFGVVRVSQPVGVDMLGFGITIETPRFQQAWFENGVGGRGGFHNQIAFADKSVITAAEAGYLYTNVIGS